MSLHHRVELAVPVSAADHMIGPLHAPAIVIEYGDFECPNCKQAESAVEILLQHFSGNVCFVFRHFPLEEVHPHALAAAEAAEAAGAQGKFWEMHNLLFDRQLHLKAPQLRSYAEQLELDMTAFTAEIDDHIYLQRVREHQQSGRDSGVHATPTFFINGQVQDVSFGLQALFDGVKAALQKHGVLERESI